MNTYFKDMGVPSRLPRSKFWSIFEEGVLKRGVDSSGTDSSVVVSPCNEFIACLHESRISKT